MTRGTEQLEIVIDKRGGEPIYQQIVAQISGQIRSGALPPGGRLPPVRSLSEQLGVNQMTVAKAYKALASADLVDGRSGAGTVVRSPEAARPAPAGKSAGDAQGAERLRRWAVQGRIAELGRAPGVIALTGGCPSAKEIDAEPFLDIIGQLRRGDSRDLFAYSASSGLPELRRAFAALLAEQDLVLDPEEIVITSGAQQGLDLAARSLLSPGDAVVMERPSYFTALDVVRSTGAYVVGVPLLDDGLDIAALDRALAQHPVKLISLTPTFQNPTGITTSLEKRRAILSVARRYGVPILEDDYCPELRFRGETLPSLRRLAEPADRVLYVRSLGKVYLPGMRIGCIAVPAELRSRVLLTKSITDLHTSTLLQRMVAEYLASGLHRGQAARVSETYRKRQALLCDALRRCLPAAVEFRQPDGGFNLWITLPRPVELQAYYEKAVQNGVTFTLGDLFYPDEADGGAVRISFGAVEEEDLAEGARRVCALMGSLSDVRKAELHPVLV